MLVILESFGLGATVVSVVLAIPHERRRDVVYYNPVVNKNSIPMAPSNFGFAVPPGATYSLSPTTIPLAPPASTL